MDANTVVIGVDPAPSKDTVIFMDIPEDCVTEVQGIVENQCLDKTNNTKIHRCNMVSVVPAIQTAFLTIQNTKLKLVLEKIYKSLIKRKNTVLVTWDSPLTGPTLDDDNNIEIPTKSGFHLRMLESQFTKTKNCKQWQCLPAGINVRGYGGCPHWTISRHVLGLPRLGEFDAAFEDLPYNLICSDQDPTKAESPNIVEVHPALAIWLGLYAVVKVDDTTKKYLPANSNVSIMNATVSPWVYKGNKPSIKTVTNRRAKLSKLLWDNICFPGKTEPGPFTNLGDDQLDAFVNWFLGKAWVDSKQYYFGSDTNSAQVKLIGNMDTGAMLLPGTKDMFKTMQDCLTDTTAK